MKDIKQKKLFITITTICSIFTLALIVYVFGTIFLDYSIYKISILILLIMTIVCTHLYKLLQKDSITNPCYKDTKEQGDSICQSIIKVAITIWKAAMVAAILVGTYEIGKLFIG